MDRWPRRPGESDYLRFRCDPVESYLSRHALVDKGEPIESHPPLLKTRRRVQRDEAIKEWKELSILAGNQLNSSRDGNWP